MPTKWEAVKTENIAIHFNSERAFKMVRKAQRPKGIREIYMVGQQRLTCVSPKV